MGILGGILASHRKMAYDAGMAPYHGDSRDGILEFIGRIHDHGRRFFSFSSPTPRTVAACDATHPRWATGRGFGSRAGQTPWTFLPVLIHPSPASTSLFHLLCFWDSTSR